MRTLALVAAVAILLMANAHAVDPIEGAFGIKLGQVFNPTKPPVEKYGQRDAYEFTPEKPNSMFSTYLVCINPKSHVVYRIIAAKSVTDMFEHELWASQMKAFVHAKYGTLPNEAKVVKQGDRSILVTHASDRIQTSNLLEYEDSRLFAEANQEQQKIYSQGIE